MTLARSRRIGLVCRKRIYPVDRANVVIQSSAAKDLLLRVFHHFFSCYASKPSAPRIANYTFLNYKYLLLSRTSTTTNESSGGIPPPCRRAIPRRSRRR